MCLGLTPELQLDDLELAASSAWTSVSSVCKIKARSQPTSKSPAELNGTKNPREASGDDQ